MIWTETFLAPVFALARWIMPTSDGQWINAIRAEIVATSDWLQKLDLCHGLLLSACLQRLASNEGIAWFGRHLITICLVGLSGVGIAIASDMEPASAGAIIAACCIYAAIGVSALASVKTLRRCAWGALILFAALTLAGTIGSVGSALDTFYFALLLEAMALMVALILAATVLPRLAWVEDNEL